MIAGDASEASLDFWARRLRSGGRTVRAREGSVRLGESLRLPAQHEHLRDRPLDTLTPIVDPRAAR